MPPSLSRRLGLHSGFLSDAGFVPHGAPPGYDQALATETLDKGRADLIAFGRPFISNPDLVERMKRAAPLTPLDPNTLYGGGAVGYIDYPTLA